MTFTLLSLVREYQASWSGRARGKARAAYTTGPEGIALRADFQRWLNRQMKKGGEMFKMIETDHLLIQIFRKDQLDISPVRAVAEAILEYGDDPDGVPSSCINFAIPGKPFSGGQRFREICQAYRRQWPGMMLAAGTGAFKPRSHEVFKNRFHFEPHFLDWLRINLPDIERVVYPVVSRRKFKD